MPDTEKTEKVVAPIAPKAEDEPTDAPVAAPVAEATATSVAAGGSPEWNEFLPPERHAAVAAVARRHLEGHLVDEVHARHYVGDRSGATDLVLEEIRRMRTLRG